MHQFTLNFQIFLHLYSHTFHVSKSAFVTQTSKTPSPAVVGATALVPRPSSSALACLHRRRRRHRWWQTRPEDRCADTAADADNDADDDGDRIPPPRSKSRCRLPPPSTSIVWRRHNHCRHQAVFAAAATNLIVVTLLSMAVPPSLVGTDTSTHV